MSSLSETYTVTHWQECGKENSKKYLSGTTGKRYRKGMSFRSPKIARSLVRKCGRHQDGWKERTMTSGDNSAKRNRPEVTDPVAESTTCGDAIREKQKLITMLLSEWFFNFGLLLIRPFSSDSSEQVRICSRHRRRRRNTRRTGVLGLLGKTSRHQTRRKSSAWRINNVQQCSPDVFFSEKCTGELTDIDVCSYRLLIFCSWTVI